MNSFDLIKVLTHHASAQPVSLSQQLSQQVAQQCNRSKSIEAMETLTWTSQLDVVAHLQGAMLVQFFNSKQCLSVLMKTQSISQVQSILVQFFHQLSSQQLLCLDLPTARALEESLLTAQIAFSLDEEVLYAAQLMYLPIEQSPECLELIREDVVTYRDADGNHVKRSRNRLQGYTHGVLQYFSVRRNVDNHKPTSVDLSDFPTLLRPYILSHTYPHERHTLSPKPFEPPMQPHELGLTATAVTSTMNPKRALALLTSAWVAVASGRAHVGALLLSWIAISDGFDSIVPTTRRFKVDLFHSLSQALGQFHVKFELVWNCIQKMECYSLYPSDLMTTLVAKQEAFVNYGLYEVEDCIFSTLVHLHCLPASSLLMLKSLEHHLKAACCDAEDTVVELILDLHHHSQCDVHCNGQPQKDSSTRILDLLEQLRRTFNFIQSQCNVPKDLLMLIGNGLAVSKVYEGLIKSLQKEDLDARTCFKQALNLFRLTQMDTRSKVLNQLIRLKASVKPPTVSQVVSNLSLLQDMCLELDNQAHRQHSMESCQILFTHVAVWLVLFGVKRLSMVWLQHVLQAYQTMSRHRHVRLFLLHQLVTLRGGNQRQHQGIHDAPVKFLGHTQKRCKMALEEALREPMSSHASDRESVMEYIKRDEGMMADLYRFGFVSLQNYHQI